MNLLYGKSIISIADVSRAMIEQVLAVAAKIKQGEVADVLAKRVIASCFFEPSTRTRLSFEAAVYRLGGQVIGFADAANTSDKKGENLQDTVRMVSGYADGIILRHPASGSAQLAAEVAHVPVINAGDGGNQHPTQTLLDLFTIQEKQGRLDGLNIALVGDLKYGRTVHSLAQALKHFSPRFFLVAPQSLEMPDAVCAELHAAGVQFSCHQNLDAVLPDLDVLYMTRLQKERFTTSELQTVKQQFVLTPDVLSSAKETLSVLHPLPRVGEIDPCVDDLPQAHYFEQAANGVPVRQALFSLVFQQDM